jgi:hypothetical protein
VLQVAHNKDVARALLLSQNAGIRTICRPFEGASLQKSLHC